MLNPVVILGSLYTNLSSRGASITLQNKHEQGTFMKKLVKIPNENADFKLDTTVWTGIQQSKQQKFEKKTTSVICLIVFKDRL